MYIILKTDNLFKPTPTHWYRHHHSEARDQIIGQALSVV